MGDEEKKNREGKGFAGLSSLVSDVDTGPGTSESTRSRVQPGAASSGGSKQPQRPAPPPQGLKQPSTGSSGGKWMLGIAIGVGALWLIGQLDKPSSPSTPAYTASAQAPSPIASGTPAPPPTPETPSAPEEAMPPVGSDLVLSTDQIRYCLAEDIRMDAAKSVVDSYNGLEVDRFNTMVADYNTRCGSFRYRSGALESARRDVEQYRAKLIEEGRRRLDVYRESQLKSGANEDERRSQDPWIGEQTQFAEERSTVDEKAEQDTAAPQSTSPGLVALPSVSTPDATAEIDPVRSSLPETIRAGPPANAFVSGASWYCNAGFRRVGNSCEALVVPENAFVSGASWYCNAGFKRVGDQCEALVVPANAFVSGASWYCNAGFRRVGNSCEALVVPENAFVSGANWYCNSGFKRVGNRCVSIY